MLELSCIASHTLIIKKNLKSLINLIYKHLKFGCIWRCTSLVVKVWMPLKLSVHLYVQYIWGNGWRDRLFFKCTFPWKWECFVHEFVQRSCILYVISFILYLIASWFWDYCNFVLVQVGLYWYKLYHWDFPVCTDKVVRTNRVVQLIQVWPVM